MKNAHKEKKQPKEYTFTIDHNPYDVLSYNNLSKYDKVIVFPIVHYEGVKQYIDLLNPFIEKGYHVVTINLISKGDRVLFFNYYFTVFEKIMINLIQQKVIKNEEIVLMGFGVGAYLASSMQKSKLKGICSMLLISPVNKYKDEYQISREIQSFKIPTYIFFGEFDSVNTVDSRYAIYEKGRTNNKVTFLSYSANGYYLFYRNDIALSLAQQYRLHDYDLLIGESSKYKTSSLPDDVSYNERFFNHVYSILEDKPLPKRIALLTDNFPLFTNGVAMVVSLLQKELTKLGYETYIVALWNKKRPLSGLPDDTYVPIIGSYAHLVKGHKDLEILKTFNFVKQAKMLAPFGFDYLHLHTEYTMSQIALLLSKMSGVKMVYTYHTLWKLYYEQHFGKLIGDITYVAAKELLFNRVYHECPVITVPSYKSHEILSSESDSKDIRVIPSPINPDRFVSKKDDKKIIESLRSKYDLEGKKVLGYVGRVSTEKNIVETLDYLAEVKNEIPNIMFMIVGVGDAVVALKKTIKKLKLNDYVIFVGEVPNDELKYYYSLFDVFVTASNFETQGLTYFEAATNGTVILAKKDRAIDGLFVDNESAYIYEDFYQWVERLEKALFQDNSKIINNAKNVMKKYTPDKWAKKLLGIYQELNPARKK